MTPPEPSRILLDKAAQDELAVDRLMQFPDGSTEIIAFHLQQAAEKMLKAALVALGVSYRFTHNLGELIHLLETNGRPLPTELDRLRDLTPYATEWRYDFLPPEDSDVLDPRPYRKLVSALRSWTETVVSNRGE